MSPMKFIVVFALAFCAVEVAQARSREPRDVIENAVGSIVDKASKKLDKALNSASDSTESSMGTVTGYLKKLEGKLLDIATEKLRKSGSDFDLRGLYEALKGNLTECASKNQVKQKLTEVTDDLFTCSGTDVGEIRGIADEIQGVWEIAKKVPAAIKEVFRQCKAHVEEGGEAPVPIPPTDDDDDDETDIDADLNEIVSANSNRSKRGSWNIKRVVRCFKQVYKLAKTDIISLPGKVISLATRAYRVYKASNLDSPQLKTCLSTKFSENTEKLTSMAKDLSSCVGGNMVPGYSFLMSMAGNALSG